MNSTKPSGIEMRQVPDEQSRHLAWNDNDPSAKTFLQPCHIPHQHRLTTPPVMYGRQILPKLATNIKIIKWTEEVINVPNIA